MIGRQTIERRYFKAADRKSCNQCKVMMKMKAMIMMVESRTTQEAAERS